MTPERWRQAAEAFEAALELKGDERSAFLARLSSDDPALRSEVEALLAEDALQAQTPQARSSEQRLPEATLSIAVILTWKAKP
jgi:hypothetical protein